METILFILAAFTALAFGSFLSAMSYRLPRGQGLVAERSACPSCHKPLSWKELFPLFSWLLQKGRCRQCQTPIHGRYPAIEITTALALGLQYALWAPDWSMLGLYIALVLILLLMSIIDIEHRILPDSLQLLLFGLGILKLLWNGDLQESLLGIMIAGGLGCALHYGYPLIRKREGLGFGDVKFFAIAGLWVGVSGLPLFFLLGGLGGVILGVIWRMIYKEAQFPFGPALALALWGTVLCRDMGWL